MDFTGSNMPFEGFKFDLCEVDEAIFHDIEKPFESIFYILGIQKSDLDEVADMMFLSRRMAL
jgi:hypothetical protein